jgi:hypothetical protein
MSGSQCLFGTRAGGAEEMWLLPDWQLSFIIVTFRAAASRVAALS